MRFEPTPEQAEFAHSLGELMVRADSVTVARRWAEGDTAPGKALWSRLADQGVCALIVAEDDGGLGGTDADLAMAFETLGYHLAVGPWIESAAYLASALTGPELEAVAAGEMATLSVAELAPYCDAAGVSEHVFCVTDEGLHRGETTGTPLHSVDTTRLLSSLSPTQPLTSGDLDLAANRAVLAASAHLLGAGERLLSDAVEYVKQRRQFGREIGSYQAIKHQLADARIALDFARPLVWGAALQLDDLNASAAKLSAQRAAYLTARTALQVHGAIGYTAEYDLGLWFARVRALSSTWGTDLWHQQRVLKHVSSQ